MVGKSFATLSCCVLMYFSIQVEFAHTPTIDLATIKAMQHNAVLPAVIPHTNPRQVGSSPSERENVRDVLAMALNLPATKFISWSHKVTTFLSMPLIQQNCLTTAIYFEARSESLLGQLAVATVILNGVKSSNSSICGVVYKGASHFNACQFSFACDGKPDAVDESEAWREAVKISNLAVANDSKTYSAVLEVLASATYYHADYVEPRWSRSLNRLAKIGRHIFYSQGSTVGTIANRKNYI